MTRLGSMNALVLVGLTGAGALALGCGDDAGPPAPRSAGPVTLEAAAGGRTVVARVDGAPIYADCVKTQVRLAGVSKRRALDQCIEFELLARAGHSEYGADPEVREAGRRESVRVLLERVLEPSIDEPEDVPEQWIRDEVWSQPRIYRGFNRPEFRRVAFARTREGKNASPEKRARAARLAEDWLRAVRRNQPQSPEEFEKVIREATGERTSLLAFNRNYELPREGKAIEEFAAATFALEEPGDVTPVIDSPVGKFVIFYHRQIPARIVSFDQALPKMRKRALPRWQRESFLRLVEGLREKAEVEIRSAPLRTAHIDIDGEVSAASRGGKR